MLERSHTARFTVEGRIGGRWWVWQRFATHDEAAREIERMAGEGRFDGARLIETVPSWNGAPPVSRELFVLDPKGPRATDIAAAEAERVAAPPTGMLFVPPVAIAPPPPPAPPPSELADDALIAAPVADAMARALARVAAAARAAAEEDAAALVAEPLAVEPPAAEPFVAAPLAAEPSAIEPSQPRWISVGATPPASPPANPIERSAADWLPPSNEAPAPHPNPPPPRATPKASSRSGGRGLKMERTSFAPSPSMGEGWGGGASPQADDAMFLDDAMPLPAVVSSDLSERDPFADAGPVVGDALGPIPANAESADRRVDADRLWSEFIALERMVAAPANDDRARDETPLPSFAIYDDEDRVPTIPRAGQWRFRLRKVAYTLGAGVASLLLCVASYETTRLLIGLPDLLGEIYQAAGALMAGPERPIVAAARRGSQEEVAQFLRGGFSPNSEDPQGIPALLVAARGGHVEVVRALLDAGADPSRRFGANDTPLLAAARDGLLASVDVMMARGGQVNGRGGIDDCDTPLLVAANAGRLEMVNYLLTRGATFDVLPGCRRGPLDAAAAHPRVRDVLETAYQRRLAGVPRAIPATLTAEPLPATRDAAASPNTGKAVADPPVDVRGYATLMYGFTWRDTLAEVKARAKECRAVGRRYEVCELQVRPLFDDAALIEAWFDRGDGDRFVSIETRSIELVDYTAHRDGATVRQRFDQVRREIERYLPSGQRPIVQRAAPTTLPFFEGLKPEIAAGDFSVFWSDDGRRRPASVHLKLSGIDARKGFYRIVVSNPLRQSQQAAVSE